MNTFLNLGNLQFFFSYVDETAPTPSEEGHIKYILDLGFGSSGPNSLNLSSFSGTRLQEFVFHLQGPTKAFCEEKVDLTSR